MLEQSKNIQASLTSSRLTRGPRPSMRQTDTLAGCSGQARASERWVQKAAMLSIVIPTLNAERALGATLEALVPGALTGLVSQIVVSDGGSGDATLAIAHAAGADVVTGAAGRGAQLARGAG